MQLALSTEQRESRCRGRQHSLRTAERFYARRVSLTNSAEMALDVGEGLAAATLERTKVAREALLAEAANVAAQPVVMSLAALAVGCGIMHSYTSHEHNRKQLHIPHYGCFLFFFFFDTLRCWSQEAEDMEF